ncbi:MAG: glycosyltransferase family 2 protein [Thermoleophilia bacterium]|nr:glycosyltransferase family 2 protein [Thermoleophilia bacterium]
MREQRDELSDVTVVIPNSNTADLTRRSVAALVDDGVPSGRIVVVDNGSTDGERARIERELEDCVLVVLPTNVGFARAVNAGARALPGRAYLFVNSDAFVHRPGSVARLLSALDDPRVGVAVPRLLNVDLSLQRNVVPVHTPAVALVRASGLSRFVPDRWQPRWSTHWSHASSREIQAADGAVMLVRSQAWEALGGFDERLHMYAEDLDVCWRAGRLGWKVWFAHDAEFVHVGQGTTSKSWGSPRRAELIGRSEGAMIRRNMSPLRARATLACLSAGLLARIAVYSLLGNRDATATLWGSLRGYAAPRRAARAEQTRG